MRAQSLPALLSLLSLAACASPAPMLSDGGAGDAAIVHVCAGEAQLTF